MASSSPGLNFLDLADGRRLAYRLYGDPGGEPVVWCHGGLVSGYDAAPAHDAAARLVCLLAPDRPGVGGSSRRAGHGVRPWAEHDLGALLEARGVERCAVVGWSEGGQYALAAAVAHPGRVTRAVVLAGCLPLDDPVVLAQLNGLDLALTLASRHAPWATEVYARGTQFFARRVPALLWAGLRRHASPDEVRAVRRQGDWMARIFTEGAAQPAGVVDEYRALVAPWGFAPEDVSIPVTVHQGTADTLVPVAWGRALAARLPRGRLVLHEGEGHLIGLTRLPGVLTDLVGDHGGPAVAE
jgi:pimeloyl-ACP methyl ester carboxylesterase